MKKLSIGIAATALAGIMCLGLTACGGDIKGEELPSENFEEAWAAAFDEAHFENVKVTASLTEKTWGIDGTVSGDVDYSITCIRADGLEYGKWSANVKVGDDGVDEYEFPRQGEYYFNGEVFYMKKSGKWVVFDPKDFEFEMYRMDGLLGLVCSFKDSEEMFSYDTKRGGYLYEVDGGEESNEMCLIKIKGGKVVNVNADGYAFISGGGGGYYAGNGVNLHLTYGGQTVTLPEGIPTAEEQNS